MAQGMLKLPIGAASADIRLEERYLPLADNGAFVQAFMGLISREHNACVLGGSCAGLLQCRKYSCDWPRQPQDIDIYASCPEAMNLHTLLGEAIGSTKVSKVERKEYSPVVNKLRCCTWWIHLEIDGQDKKLEVDVKETHEKILARHEEVDGVPCMALKDLSRFLVSYGAETEGDYRYFDLQAFENSGVDLSSDNSPLLLNTRIDRRFSSFGDDLE
jgi:hypothetical protein